MSARRAIAAAAVACGLLLYAVGQPIFTDDLWWHLGLGRAFAQHGPWLAEDPLLFAPAGPPSALFWSSSVSAGTSMRASAITPGVESACSARPIASAPSPSVPSFRSPIQPSPAARQISTATAAAFLLRTRAVSAAQARS